MCANYIDTLSKKSTDKNEIEILKNKAKMNKEALKENSSSKVIVDLKNTLKISLDIFSSDYNFNLIKEKKYVDNDLLEKLFKKYKDLIKYTNETRKLYHGDFGSNNLLVEADNILGVIDWDMASYGDPLYEIANTYFWSTWLLCMKRSYAYFEKEYGNIKNYQELIKCYCIRIALIEIYENALIGNEEMTIWLQDRISKICL